MSTWKQWLQQLLEPEPLAPGEQAPRATVEIRQVRAGGEGLAAAAGCQVTLEYQLRRPKDEVLADSRRSGLPLRFTLGHQEVIPGLEAGVLGMTVGEVRELTIPAPLAYGPAGAPPSVPPNTSLCWEVELLAVENLPAGD